MAEPYDGRGAAAVRAHPVAHAQVFDRDRAARGRDAGAGDEARRRHGADREVAAFGVGEGERARRDTRQVEHDRAAGAGERQHAAVVAVPGRREVLDQDAVADGEVAEHAGRRRGRGEGEHAGVEADPPLPAAWVWASSSVPEAMVMPPLNVLAAARRTVPAPLMISPPLPAFAPVPPEPVWSAIAPATSSVVPAAAPRAMVAFPCRNSPEPCAPPPCAPVPAGPRR